jgi:hypothetical protein
MAFSKGDIDAQEKKILQRVSCFNMPGPDRDIFRETRGFAQPSHYDLYERAGMTGLMKNASLFETRV